MRRGARGSHKFYARGITLYPEKQLYQEMSFISYYFHWGEKEVMDLSHASRRRWCEEISSINSSLNPSDDTKIENSLFELGKSARRR